MVQIQKIHPLDLGSVLSAFFRKSLEEGSSIDLIQLVERLSLWIPLESFQKIKQEDLLKEMDFLLQEAEFFLNNARQ